MHGVPLRFVRITGPKLGQNLKKMEKPQGEITLVNQLKKMRNAASAATDIF
jgi:hypothetical protein